jgi:hypothetical protein
LKSNFTAFATGSTGFVVRTLLTGPLVLVWVAASVALVFGSSTFAGTAGAGVEVVLL